MHSKVIPDFSSVILLIRVHAIWYNKRIVLKILLVAYIVSIFSYIPLYLGK